MSVHQDPLIGDAFGRALLAHLEGSPWDRHYIERSDGLMDSVETDVYFAAAPWWPDVDRDAVERAAGGERVLDIGAGAGRASLELQANGVPVTALDVSTGAIETCRRRGVVDTVQGTIADLVTGGIDSRYDTFLMLGNNIGLLEGPDAAATVLRQLATLGTDDARIVGTVGHIYRTEEPDHLAYHERNRAAGRMAGQIRLRVRYRRLATPWFDYLLASPAELAAIVKAAGWVLTDVVDRGGSVYMAEICRR